MKCAQRVVREQLEHLGCPVVAPQAAMGVVRPIGYAEARTIIRTYEWLGTMWKTLWHYGIFFDGFCAGVVCYGRYAMKTANGLVHGVPARDVLYLARGACTHWAPPNTNSRLVSMSLRLLRRDVPNVKLVVAYADQRGGEIGTIYQACNWLCLGRSGSPGVFRREDGRCYDLKALYDQRRKSGMTLSRRDVEERFVRSGWQREDAVKWVYVYPMDSTTRSRLAERAVPYPKRERSADSGTAVPAAGGGAIPTRSLQTEVRTCGQR